MIKDMKIETNRLLIRAYHENDLLEAFQLMQNKELFEHLPMEVMSFEEYKRLFNWLRDCYEKSYKDKWFKYSFVITDKNTGRQLGWCGVGSLDFNHNLKEIFYLIGRPYWGMGYASEAIKGLLEYCKNTLEIEEISAVVKPGNKASKRIIEKLEFNYEYTISGLSDEYDFYNGELFYTKTMN
jgi:ribosomal-protein-alanine N-acetyltransferase